MKDVDFITLCFASIVYFVMYMVWYSNFLFGKIYKNILKRGMNKSFLSYLIIFICVFISAYILAIFEILIGVTSFWDGVFLGFLIWLGFVATHSLFLIVSQKRNLKLFFIDNILYLLALMIVAGILAG